MNPVWFWQGWFANGTTMTFYADNKALAEDHAATVARDTRTTLRLVTRLKHAKDVTPDEARAAGTITSGGAL